MADDPKQPAPIDPEPTPVHKPLTEQQLDEGMTPDPKLEPSPDEPEDGPSDAERAQGDQDAVDAHAEHDRPKDAGAKPATADPADGPFLPPHPPETASPEPDMRPDPVDDPPHAEPKGRKHK